MWLFSNAAGQERLAGDLISVHWSDFDDCRRWAGSVGLPAFAIAANAPRPSAHIRLVDTGSGDRQAVRLIHGIHRTIRPVTVRIGPCRPGSP